MKISRGTLLPSISLIRAPDLQGVELRTGRGPLVLVVVHSSDCSACQSYVRGLVDSGGMDEWGARVLALVCDSARAATRLQESIGADCYVLADPECSLGVDRAAVVVADEWGEVYFAAEIEDHVAPTPAQIAEWVQFIAIQCPECEPPEANFST